MIAAALLLLAAGACREPTADTQAAMPMEANHAADVDETRVACVPAGARAFARACTLDREEEAGGLILTVRHPDGGFRRLRVTRDGRGVVAADGAAPAAVTIVEGDEIEVAIGDDRYRLPATVRTAR